MFEQIKFFLEEASYVELTKDQEEFKIFFRLENNFVNAIHVIDYDHLTSEQKAQTDQMLKPIKWQVNNGPSVEVHMIALIITEHMEEVSALTADNIFCWFIDPNTKELIVPDGKVEDFYGLRDKLTAFLKEPFDVQAYKQRLLDEQEEEAVTHKEPVFKRFLNGAVVNHVIIAVNILVFLICIFTGDLLLNYGAREVSAIVYEGQWYRIITSMFLHADSYHLFSNMVWLFFLGDAVENMSGHIKYLFIYFTAGIGGGIVSMYIEFMSQSFVSSVGASGAVFGIEGALLWILIRNHGRVEYMTIPKLVFALACSLYYGLISTNVDNAAHLGGLITGFIITVLIYRKKKVLQGRKEL